VIVLVRQRVAALSASPANTGVTSGWQSSAYLIRQLSVGGSEGRRRFDACCGDMARDLLHLARRTIPGRDPATTPGGRRAVPPDTGRLAPRKKMHAIRNSSMKKKFLAGVLASILAVSLIAVVTALSVMKLGLVAINADQSPPAWEVGLLSMAVHDSVARHAPRQSNPVPATNENLIAGAEIYAQMCAKCHGQPNAGPSVFGASFYPPAPQLPGRPTRYTEAELFWIVKHGIRNTSMPAWGSLLSDQDIWQVVALVKRFDALPPAVKAGWRSHRGASGE